MRIFEAEAPLIRDLKDETEIIAEREYHGLTVVAARHPTLGKLVIVETADGAGVIVETEE
jgi:hypothetical protein